MTTQERHEDVIDLSELLRASWARSWLVAIVTLVGVGLGILVSHGPVFQAKAVFEFVDPFAYSREVIADPLNNDPVIDDPVIERLIGSNFVNGLFDYLVDINSADMMPIDTMNSEDATRSNKIIDAQYREEFLENYLNSVKVSRTLNGAIQVVVTHSSAERATVLANITAEQAVRFLADQRQNSANALLEEATSEIAEAKLREDDAYSALTAAVRSKATDATLQNLQMELASAQARHELLLAAFSANMRSAVAMPESRVVEVATMPTEPLPQGVSPLVVFGAIGCVVGILISTLLGVLSGRIYSTDTMARLAQARVNGVERRRSALISDSDLHAMSFDIEEPDATEILVVLRSRGASVVFVAATDDSISPLPAALWLARRISGGIKPATVISFGFKAQTLGAEVADTVGLQESRYIVKQKHSSVDVLFPTDQFDLSLHLPDLVTGETNRDQGGVIVLASNSVWSTAVLRVALRYSPSIVVLTKKGKTRRSSLEALRRLTEFDTNIMVRA